MAETDMKRSHGVLQDIKAASTRVLRTARQTQPLSSGEKPKASSAHREAVQSGPVGRPPLIAAVEDFHEEQVDELLKQGAAVDAQDALGNTALIYAVRKQSLRMVTSLLEHGASVDLRGHLGRTALMQAAMGRDQAVLKLCLKHTTNLDVQDSSGDTAMSYAKAHQRKHVEVLEEARRNPVQVHIPDFSKGELQTIVGLEVQHEESASVPKELVDSAVCTQDAIARHVTMASMVEKVDEIGSEETENTDAIGKEEDSCQAASRDVVFLQRIWPSVFRAEKQQIFSELIRKHVNLSTLVEDAFETTLQVHSGKSSANFEQLRQQSDADAFLALYDDVYLMGKSSTLRKGALVPRRREFKVVLKQESLSEEHLYDLLVATIEQRRELTEAEWNNAVAGIPDSAALSALILFGPTNMLVGAIRGIGAHPRHKPSHGGDAERLERQDEGTPTAPEGASETWSLHANLKAALEQYDGRVGDLVIGVLMHQLSRNGLRFREEQISSRINEESASAGSKEEQETARKWLQLLRIQDVTTRSVALRRIQELQEALDKGEPPKAVAKEMVVGIMILHARSDRRKLPYAQKLQDAKAAHLSLLQRVLVPEDSSTQAHMQRVTDTLNCRGSS
eukprot:scaffold3403_cov300-Pinguiococcus_pyrenoidosus.AAC.12